MSKAIITEEAIEGMVSSHKANRITSDSIDLEYVKGNPAFLALSKTEREAYLMHLNGCLNNDICDALELKPYQVTRLLQGIHAKLDYLYTFREMLSQFPVYELKFYHGKEIIERYKNERR